MSTDEHIPERIYVQAHDDGEYILWDYEATWYVDRVNDDDLVYILEETRQRDRRRLRRVLATAKLDRSLRVAMEGALHLVGDERDDLRRRLEEARNQCHTILMDVRGWIPGAGLRRIHYRERLVSALYQLAAALRDTTNVADKRTDGVDSQPDIADNGEEE